MIIGNVWSDALRELALAMWAGDRYRQSPSAAVAKHRLRKIIAADREAVPACRWVKKMDQCVTLVIGMPRPKHPIWPPRKLYRWERCR